MTSSEAPAVRLRAAGAILVLLAVVLVGCSGSSESDDTGTTDAASSSDGAPAPGVAAAEAALAEGRVVIDVRTPEEFDAGHVEGAELIDVQDPGFDAAIAQLDPDVEYVVYCRTGNRSAAAAERMRAVGLDVADGGGFDDMVEAGWPSTD